jgi:hypothetical protein
MTYVVHASSYMQMAPKFIAEASGTVNCAISVYSNVLSLRVGARLGATCWFIAPNRNIADLLTFKQHRDNVSGRALTSAAYTDATNMTVENCVNFCNNQHYVYAGAEYGQECCKYYSSLISAVIHKWSGTGNKIAGIT